MGHFGYGTTEVSGKKMTSQEIENAKLVRAHQAKKARAEKIEQLTADIKYCNDRLGNMEFITSATPENVKALVLLRLEFLSQKNELLK